MRNKANPTANSWLNCCSALLGLSLLATNAMALDDSIPDCALKPSKPNRVVTVSGFPAERLYIHRQYPGGVSEAKTAAAVQGVYVISGDRLSVSESCNNWSFVEFHGKKSVTGWVRSTRLPSDIDARQQAKFAESVPASAHPACLEAEALLNEALQKGHEPITGLASALSNKTTLDTLPAGVGQAGATASGTEWDVQIQGQPLKAIAYDLGGSCSIGFLELWKRDFSARIPVPGSNADNTEEAWASGDDFVRLHGRTYFVHSIRRGSFLLASFDKTLSTSAMCKIDSLPTRQEVTAFAADPSVCDDVLAGRVDGAPIDDIEPIDITEETLGKSVVDKQMFQGARGWTMVGRGRIDIDNDGKLDDVGIVVYDEASGSGCGHEFHTTWPLKLNADGVPAENTPFNRMTYDGVGGDDNDTRIFQIRGTTYLEYRSFENADGLPLHEVWKYTSGGGAKICKFVPVRYRATDIH
jgi:hypothetical protein